MRLEDFRGVHVGDVAVMFEDGGMLPAAFHHHAQVAFAHTINELIRLSGESVPGHWDPRIGAVEWWRTIEGLVALLHQVVVRERDAGMRPGLADSTGADTDIMEKWSAAARWFSGGRHSPPSRLSGLVTELRDFRNSFEHATRMESRKRHHSKLAESPAFANAADLMEATAICTAASGYFRYVLPGNNLMPQVVVPSRDYIMFEPLDVVAREVLFPLFNSVLKERGLTTDVTPYDDFGHTSGMAKTRVRFLVRYEDEKRLPDAAETIKVLGEFTAWADARDTPDPGTMRLPSYSAGMG